MTAFENAGFDVKDIITHLHGQGFPKSLDVSKAIDKTLGAERTVVGTKPGVRGADGSGYETQMPGKAVGVKQVRVDVAITAPTTDEAKAYQGYGTALKPAAEFYVLVRKPLDAPTVAKNVLLHGTGGLNIDASRIGTDEIPTNAKGSFSGWKEQGVGGFTGVEPSTHVGRWPANVVLSHSAECYVLVRKPLSESTVAKNVLRHGTGALNIDASRIGTDGGGTHCPHFPQACKGHETAGGAYTSRHTQGNGEPKGRWPANVVLSHSDECGEEAVVCAESCPVAELDRQSGKSKSSGGRIGKKSKSIVEIVPSGKYAAGDPGFGDIGGASRFFKTFACSEKMSVRYLVEQEKHSNILDETSCEALTANDAESNAGLPRKLPDIAPGAAKAKAKRGPINSNHSTSATRQKCESFANNNTLPTQSTGAKSKRECTPTGTEDHPSLVADAAQTKPIDTTITDTRIPSTSFGYAEAAIFESTSASMELGAKDSERQPSRFKYCAKPSTREKNEGLGEEIPLRLGGSLEGGDDKRSGKPQLSPRKNHHPTVKALALMEYLIRLVTPSGGTVLDPFMGSGTTLLAAKNLGFDAIGIEQDAEYIEIARARLGESSTGFERAEPFAPIGGA
jgi:hypothetical protein